MSAYSLTFFLSKIRLNKPKTNQNCQRMYVFVFLNVQERIFKKRTKNHEEMTKRARDLKKCQKPEPGKLSDQSQSSYGQKESSKFQKLQEWSLVIRLKDLHVWSFDFQDCQKCSLEEYYWRYDINDPSRIMEESIWALGLYFLKIGSYGLLIFRVDTFGPLVNIHYNRILSYLFLITQYN